MNIQQPTFNVERPSELLTSKSHWMLGVECWMFDVFFGISAFLCLYVNPHFRFYKSVTTQPHEKRKFEP